jgi:YVTN family beta-propeller protein
LAVNPVTNKVYVANAHSNDVTVIDGSNNSTASVTVGYGPLALAVNPVTNKVYVANAHSDSVTVIDGNDHSTTTVAVGYVPVAVAVNPVTNKIYLVNFMRDTLTVIGGSDHSTTTVAVGDGPLALAVNPVTDMIYVANPYSDNVTVIAGSHNITTTVAAGNIPRALAVNPKTNQVYVANSNSVTVINGSDNSTTTVASGPARRSLAVNPETNRVYVADFNSDTVTVIDGSDTTVRSLLPGQLAIYFGFPSVVNGTTDLKAAAEVFAAYEIVVLGATVQFPQYDPNDPNSNPLFDNGCTQNAYYDHNNARAIIEYLTTAPNDTRVYGYISIGGENTARICPSTAPLPTPLTDLEIQREILRWKEMGVTGMFFDESGYDFGTPRERQNQAVDFAHSEGLSVFINGYDLDDILGTAEIGVVTYPDGSNLGGQQSSMELNPHGLPPHLGPEDIVLLESFQIRRGEFENPAAWVVRSEKAREYKDKFGIRIATVTTSRDDEPDCGFDQRKFDYALWSAALYCFDVMGWKEGSNFSASGECNGKLPPRPRPTPRPAGVVFTSPVIHEPPLHTRETSAGRIEVNTETHTGQLIR